MKYHETTELKQHCDSVPGIALLSPGALLKQARHEMGYTQIEVARRLNLSVKIITAIEKDDYKDLPGLSYIRGYLRAYANLLNCSADKVLKAFEEQGYASSAELPDRVQNNNLASVVLEKEHIARVLSYILIVAFIAMSFLWWNNHGDHGQKLLGEIRVDFDKFDSHKIIKGSNNYLPSSNFHTPSNNNLELNSDNAFGKPEQFDSENNVKK